MGVILVHKPTYNWGGAIGMLIIPSPIQIWHTPIAWSQWNVEIPNKKTWSRLGGV